jgi:predicted ATP-dependent protease
MAALVQELPPALAAAFESDEFRARGRAIEQAFRARQEAAFGALGEQAAAQGLAMLNAPVGITFAPLAEGTVMAPEAFQQLDPAERERIQATIAGLEEALRAVLQEVPRWEREGREAVRALAREVAAFAVNALMADERERYAELPEVRRYLEAVRDDIVANVRRIAPGRGAEEEDRGVPAAFEGDGEPFLRRYRVNVAVDHGQSKGAPVVYEDNPTLANLVGRVDYVPFQGGLVTDFNLIKAGALQRANGGFLMLDAAKVVAEPFAWAALKRALYAGQVRIEAASQLAGGLSTISLQPAPTPLALKVVLIGDRELHALLAALDPDFGELFKVGAEFDDATERDPERSRALARLLVRLARREALRPFAAEAVARVLEASARAANDAGKLSLELHRLSDLLAEADHWAAQRGAEVVAAEDVDTALAAAEARAGRARDRLREAVLDGELLVATDGEAVGQVNALSVLAAGAAEFGQPSRVTARAWVGRGAVLDIEREVALGGALHAKGVLILSGFLAGRYARTAPLSLAASLVFEQTYGGVEGDSASLAELYALLSAISGQPVRQAVAVTGSVNQHGEAQAIGGVNVKVEGFFDICRARGLTGGQGVLIPAANAEHLMLRPDLVAAAAAGTFHVWTIRHVDEGVRLLFGLDAGTAQPDGRYPEGSLNRLVADRLAEFARQRRDFRDVTGEPEG